MPQTEENNTPPQQPEATNDPVAKFDDEFHIVDAMKPTAATTPDNKPLRYGTRKKKAGEAGPNIKDLKAVSSFEEEEEIEMDDLPIRANAPEELIDTRTAPSEYREESGERRPRRNDRPRGERRERKPRERSPRRDADPASADTETQPATEVAAAAQAEGDRPDRFGTVKPSPAAAAREPKVDEFRPSRDGRSNTQRERKPRSSDSSRSKAPAKKKGLLAKIVGFFAGGAEEEEKQPQEAREARRERPGDRQRGGRGRRGPNERQNRDDNRDGGEGGGQRRRRRPRNRKPRQDGEKGERQNREGGENRRRRRPRRPRSEDGKQSDADAREIGRRAREESEASKK